MSIHLLLLALQSIHRICRKLGSTIAIARSVKQVIGVDLMNGVGRYGWWLHFNKALELLGLSLRVQGLRADATLLPLRDSMFNSSCYT